MNKFLYLFSVIAFMAVAQLTFADEVKLKRACLKDNPIMQGVSDADLIQIYTQICDKKNKQDKSPYLLQAAQRFYAIGQNYQALQLVGYLESQSLTHRNLTDLKFLLGARLANDAITTMRDHESRHLTAETTYPVAKNLTERIQQTLPNNILAKANSTAQVNTHKSIQNNKKTSQKRQYSSKPQTTKTHELRSPSTTVKPTSNKAQTPFSNL